MYPLFKHCLALLAALSFVSIPITILASDAHRAPVKATGNLHPWQSSTLQAQAQVIVRADIINMRSGPDTSFSSVGQLQRSQICPITGRDVSNAWWQIQCPGIGNGWVFGQLVDLAGNTAGIPVINVALPPTAVPAPLPAFYGWKAAYFNNRDLAGGPVAQADVGDINLNWGGGSPHPAVPPDNFSARFERVINFNPGTYRFIARPDDAVRVWIDNQLIIDEWHSLLSGYVDYTADRYMYGTQTVRVEYYEDSGGAFLSFAFIPLMAGGGGGNPSGDWEVSYFNNTDLAGGPAIVRGEARSPSYPLDQDWGLSSPAPGAVDNDNWSARWRGRFFFEGGDFFFRARSDDGVRVYIDGIRLIDAWYDGFKEPSNRFLGVGRGDHEIVVEFYERGGAAANRVWWYRDGTDNR